MTSTEFVYTTYIKSTAQNVWNAITNAEFTRQYWGCEFLCDWQKGAKWTAVRNTDGNTIMVGEVIEVSPPNKLAYTWHLPDTSAESDKSRVTFEIETIKDTVKLTVIHDKLEKGSDMTVNISRGWPLVLSNLKSFLETGEAFDIFAVKGTCSAQETPQQKLTNVGA
ncbi:MAG: SRPBCC family protein [Cyanobacteria bacterium SZAS LIN-3]|nr:SRPBCC family protein [Cyanobacteria bacterium SZAS LIN-3]